MDLIAQFGNTLAIAVVGVLVWFYMRGRFEQIDRRSTELKQDMNQRFDQNDRRLEALASEIAAVRSDLTHVALAVGARTRPEANQA